MLKIPQQLRPHQLPLTNYYCVGVLSHFVGQQGGVRTADCNRHTAPAKFARQGIGMWRGRCVCGDAHEVRGFVEINPLDNLIGMAHLPMVRGPGRQQRHRELGKSNQPPVTHKERGFSFGCD